MVVEPTEIEEIFPEYDFSQGVCGKLPVSMKAIMGNDCENVYTIDDYYNGARHATPITEVSPTCTRSLCLDDKDGYNPDEDRFELTPYRGKWRGLANHRLWQKCNAAYRA